MKKELILDSEYDAEMQPYLLHQEGIEWEGKPQFQFRITFLEWEALSVNLAFFLTILGIISYLCFDYGSMFWGSILILPIVLVIIAPEIYKYFRRKYTKYEFSKNRIHFQLWRWGKTTHHYIDFAEVHRIVKEEFKNGKGTIFFMPKTSFDFRTYDFNGGLRRHHPTFEAQHNVNTLYEQLEAFRRNRTTFD